MKIVIRFLKSQDVTLEFLNPQNEGLENIEILVDDSRKLVIFDGHER